MIQITGLTSSPSQTFNIPDPVTRKTIYFTMRFCPRVAAFFLDIEYEGFSAKSLRLVRGMNILSRHINVLPFGLAVAVKDNYEPFLINDMVSGRVSLYLLTHEECLDVQQMIVDGYTLP